MTTVEKTKKPTILTESDQVLFELQNELASLKSRMNSIEEEQEQNRSLVERLSFQEELANEAITNHQKESSQHKENYQVIANVVQNLKTPVSLVVSNLSGVIADIDDQETQKTLQECMNTASNVLTSFDDVEDFCLSAGSDFTPKQTHVVIRDFFRDTVSELQSAVDPEKTKYRLLVDKNVPEKSVIQTEAVQTCLKNLAEELQNAVEGNETSIKIESEIQEEKYGIQIQDLCISIDSNRATDLVWRDAWIDSIQINQTRLLNSGLKLLKTRDLIRKAGGHLEMLMEEGKVKGFKLSFPLTY